MDYKKFIRITLCVLLIAAIVGSALVTALSLHVSRVGSRNIITQEEALALEDVDCILVLGCLVRSDGSPSDMLYDRVKGGVELYLDGAAGKIIMSGDHGRENYDEVGVMKKLATDAGIPSSDVFMDHAGFSTYESIYRAREIFGVKKMIIVTQEYHLKRALYVAESLGIEAYGFASDYRQYRGQIKRDVREFLARAKDYTFAVFKPQPTYLGDAIPVSGNGDVTNDN